MLRTVSANYPTLASYLVSYLKHLGQNVRGGQLFLQVLSHAQELETSREQTVARLAHDRRIGDDDATPDLE